jgi:membrane-bound serine protease (ClpP class)
VITAAVGYAWLRHLPSSDRFSGLFLRHTAAQSEGYVSALPRGDLVGKDGVAVTDLRPAGMAQIGTERVDVVTEGEYVSQGTPVRVVRSEGYRHIVRGVA